MMGLEEHLLGMFREDFEFHDGAGASHHGHAATPKKAEAAPEKAVPQPEVTVVAGAPVWETDAERELKKIPFFVRGKARRNTESFARERGIGAITIETLYDAKAHFGR